MDRLYPNDYQALAMITAAPQKADGLDSLSIVGMLNAVIGLCAEAGEIADIVKKIEFHDHEYTPSLRDDLIKEVGDAQWYVAMCCQRLGISLEEVMRINIEKLQKRYPNKFNSADSVARIDVHNG